MKKIFAILILFTLISNVSYGQTEKRSRLLGGSGYFNLNDSFTFSVSPSYGQFIADDFAVGGTLTYSYWGSGNGSYIALGPFARYYVGSGPNRLLLLGNMEVGNSREYTSFSTGIGAGYTRFLTKQIGLEAILNYRNTWERGYSYDRLFVTIGFQIYLPPR